MTLPRLLLVLFMISIAVKALTGLLISQPGYMDAYYYYHVAANLAAGRGFVEDILWNYLDNPASLPHPSNLYWLPLTSLVIAPALKLFGESFRAAQVPIILLASLSPLIAFLTAERLGLSRFQSICVAGLAIFNGAYFIYQAAPDVFVPFGVVASLALFCMARGMEGGAGWFLAAAGFSALAHLARPDGLLLLAVLATMTVAADLVARAGERSGGRWGWPAVTALLAAELVVYLAVLAPWMARNVAVIGVPWPPAGEALFQREYNDLFRYGRTLDLAYYLDWGWMEIARSKLTAGLQNLNTFAGSFLYYLLPFGLLGFWQLRRRPAAWPFIVYAASLYLVMTLVFTFAGPRGAYLHSLAGLTIFHFSATAVGIAAAVHWTAGKLKHWVEPKAQRNFLIIAVAIAAVVSVYLAFRSASTWDDRFRIYQRAAGWLGENGGAGAVVMAVDPPGWWYSSRGPAIGFVHEGMATNLELARRFDVRYVLLEPAHPMGLHECYLGNACPPELKLLVTLDDLQIHEIAPDSSRTGN